MINLLTSRSQVTEHNDKNTLVFSDDHKDSFIDEIFSMQHYYIISVISKFASTNLLKCLTMIAYDKEKQTLRAIDFEGIPQDSPVTYSFHVDKIYICIKDFDGFISFKVFDMVRGIEDMDHT